MKPDKKIKDVKNPTQEFEKLTLKFQKLQNRFIAVAMDYKFYIKKDILDHEIYNIRDSILYRLYCAQFHYQLLLEYHQKVEKRHRDLAQKKGPIEFMANSFELISLQEQSIKEIYSLFDSMVYHLCSIFDYLFRLVNFIHDNIILDKPKWNSFRNSKNKKFIYCSQEMFEKLEKFDTNFVFPLIGHRSHLIHTEMDTGKFTLDYNYSGKDFNARFFATDLFKKNFPEINDNLKDYNLTIKYSSLWLIDKTIETTTEILFELKNEMKLNKKITHGIIAMIGENGEIESPSKNYWGDRTDF